MPRVHAAEPAHGGVARLLDAERQWQVALDDARARANETLDAARARAEELERAGDAECRAAVEARRRELDAAVDAARDDVRREFAGRIARFEQPSDPLIDRLARMIADRAPWFAASDNAT